MKKFTIKDLMLYHNPCRACGKNTTFRFCTETRDEDPVTLQFTDARIAPELKGTYLKIPLSIKYKDRLDLHINLITNEFVVHSKKALDDFLNKYYVYTEAMCSYCSSYITTQCLFIENYKYIMPIGLRIENFLFKNDDYNFTITNDYKDKETIVVAYTKGTQDKILNLPLMPMYKFKTKEEVLQKIKMILTFS